jgi:hypothetical protein
MKKRILVLLMFAAMSINAMAIDLWVKGGATQGIGNEKFNDIGYVAGLELSQGVLGFIDLGAGIGYNGNMKFDTPAGKTAEKIEYDAVPVYGFAKFNILPVGIKPYIVARLGAVAITNDQTNYSLIDITNNNEAEGGMYAAIGVGAEFFSSLQAEVLYSVMEVKNNPTGEDGVEIVSLTLGYNFF